MRQWRRAASSTTTSPPAGCARTSSATWPQPVLRRRDLAPGLESRWERVGGLRGHALVGGAGATVVLVHGLAVSSRYFVPLAEQLVRTRRVLAPDLPGYGRSGSPRRALGIEELANALTEWLDLAELERAPLVGNSLGCQIAVDLAARRPGRVDSLVL